MGGTIGELLIQSKRMLSVSEMGCAGSQGDDEHRQVREVREEIIVEERVVSPTQIVRHDWDAALARMFFSGASGSVGSFAVRSTSSKTFLVS